MADQLEDDTVVIRRLPDEDPSVREVRISCPDATGLGVDLTRVLLDFGLRILKGDVSTDGKWCFLIFKVGLNSNVPPRWNLLKTRLEAVCPSGADSIRSLWRWRSLPKEQMPFLLQVASYDRQGMLHSLTHALWESDTTVFKAHITTSPNAEVLDMFWLYDNRSELPENHRALEICDRVKNVLGPDAECTIAPAPSDEVSALGAASSIIRRKACKDVASTNSLSKIVDRKRSGSSRGSSRHASSDHLVRDDYVDRQAQLQCVEIVVDNETSPSYTMLTLRCEDRKGLLYDIFRTLKDIDLRVAYGKVEVFEDGICEADLFVQDAELCRVSDPDLLDELTERVRLAVALPIRIDIKDAFDSLCTELTVTADLDSGARGRPRVTFDVTQGLNYAGCSVFMADVYIEQQQQQQQVPSEYSSDDERAGQEMHRFLIHAQSGQPVRSESDKKVIYEVVKAHLMGTPVRNPAQQGLPAGQQQAQQGRAAGAGAGGGLVPQTMRSAGQAPVENAGILRSLSSKWKFGMA